MTRTHFSQICGREKSLMTLQRGGFSLIELIVSVGLFTVVMTLASGAYLLMIGINRQAQGIATGINNLSFALETMTYNIRTGKDYGCSVVGVDCPNGSNTFLFTNANGDSVSYDVVSEGEIGKIQETKNGVLSDLTDPSVNISSLKFYAFDTARPLGDYKQSRVTIIVAGTGSSGPGKVENFTVEAGATMRGSDL